MASSGSWILESVEIGGIRALEEDVVEIRLKVLFRPFWVC